MTAVRPWSPLPSTEWAPTLETVHLWTQIAGKIRLVQSPWLNHSWSVTLYVRPTGLTTGMVPYAKEGFEIAFDFEQHRLHVVSTTGERRGFELSGHSVASFYEALLGTLRDMDLPVEIDSMPNEIPDAVPFPQDTQHATYDTDHVAAWFRAVVDADRVFNRFRAGFQGKASPVHFFWGSFDLAVTRFSGRRAPEHPGGMPNFPDDVAREAYSHEVSSVGFWPGNAQAPDPVFYAYAYPTPDGFSTARVQPDGAFWLDELGEFVLPYASVAAADDPDRYLERFLESTHAAAADLAGWDRDELECRAPQGPDWWATRPHRP